MARQERILRYAQNDSVKQFFNKLLERDASEQAAFLQQACGGDEDLRREVESLLAQEETAKSFLESPALEVAAQVLAERSGTNQFRDTRALLAGYRI